MKKLHKILIIVFFITTSYIKAQETIISLKNGDLSNVPMLGDVYHKDTTNTLNKFLETWEYNDGTHYFRITFIKKNRVRISKMRIYMDELACEYLYKKNGITIYNTYGANSNINNLGANYIFGSSVYSENKLGLIYGEPPTNSCDKYASGKLTLEYIDGVIPTLNWHRVNNQLYGSNSTCPDGSDMDFTDFVIPPNMILIKQ